MDPKRTREALVWWDRVNAPGLPRQNWRPHIPVAFDAARWSVDLFEECENCGGSGVKWETPLVMGATRHGAPCPSCKGRGFSLNQERVERAMKVEALSGLTDPTQRQLATEAILAFLLEGE